MVGFVGAASSSSVTIMAARPLRSSSFFIPQSSSGLSIGRKFYGGIGVPLMKGRSQFSISNVATDISPAQQEVQKRAASKASQRPGRGFGHARCNSAMVAWNAPRLA